MAASLRCIVLCALIACALGHAVLSAPAPLNANPTKTAPCGVASYPASPTPAAQWAVNTAQTLTWNLIATDGGTAVSGALDVTGTGKSFTTVAFTNLATANGNKAYPLKFTVPAGVTCTGPNGLCLMRMVSNGNWNSCIFVNITNVVEPVPPPPPPKCVTATNLNFCTAQNSQKVLIKADATVAAIDVEVSAAYSGAINNTEVFSDGSSKTCQTDYKTYLCATNLPPCTGAVADATLTPCRSMCTDMTTSCGLTQGHEALYQCSTLPACPGDPSSASRIAAASVVLAASALASVVLL